MDHLLRGDDRWSAWSPRRGRRRNCDGLVYGLTELKHDEGVSWYKRPVPLAIAIAALALFLNIWFA